ncbi:peptidoglycan bridge formation glycyltransferase FemA/FemB family protein [Candidatus Saccharibacteria bacterium]|nr:peptidoglycan bridge formation glycyltransferase FemA/FemB family protein [Candidatus Saccharibacteria bacterium]
MSNNIDVHFQQSEAWQVFQESLGRKVFHRSGEGWEYRAILEPARFGLSRLYCPYGPTAETHRALRTALASLRALARSQNAAYVRIQPLGTEFTHEDMKRLGTHKIYYSQPAHTWCVDTTRSAEEIVADMKQNNRNLYRNYTKKDMSYKRSTKPADISRLTTLLHGVAAHNQISVHPDSYFIAQAKALMPIGAASLHFITYKKQTIAAALVYEDTNAHYYAHAAATQEYRKLGASTALLAAIIVDTHERGKQVCDLYGITTSENPDHKWAGFTRFKKSFGGYPQDLSETYEYPVKQLRHAAYRAARAIKRGLS